MKRKGSSKAWPQNAEFLDVLGRLAAEGLAFGDQPAVPFREPVTVRAVLAAGASNARRMALAAACRGVTSSFEPKQSREPTAFASLAANTRFMSVGNRSAFSEAIYWNSTSTHEHSPYLTSAACTP